MSTRKKGGDAHSALAIQLNIKDKQNRRGQQQYRSLTDKINGINIKPFPGQTPPGTPRQVALAPRSPKGSPKGSTQVTPTPSSAASSSAPTPPQSPKANQLIPSIPFNELKDTKINMYIKAEPRKPTGLTLIKPGVFGDKNGDFTKAIIGQLSSAYIENNVQKVKITSSCSGLFSGDKIINYTDAIITKLGGSGNADTACMIRNGTTGGKSRRHKRRHRRTHRK